jgi:hypothetical protein
MRTRPRSARTSQMSPDAYAGFLKLWLAPGGRIPSPSPELDAYLSHANRREPLSTEVRMSIGMPTHRAA